MNNSPLVHLAGNAITAPVRPRQAPPGVANYPINYLGFRQVMQYPQPDQLRDEDGLRIPEEHTLIFRAGPGAYIDAGGNPLKVAARIRWNAGNATNLAVLEIPQNSNIRMPLCTSLVRVELAALQLYTPTALLPSPTTSVLNYALWENPPASQFGIPVINSVNATPTVIPSIDAGIIEGVAFSNNGTTLPRRSVTCVLAANQSVTVPRPSGSATCQWLSFAQVAAPPVVRQTGFTSDSYPLPSPDTSYELLPGTDSITITNGATSQVVTLLFDLQF